MKVRKGGSATVDMPAVQAYAVEGEQVASAVVYEDESLS